MRRIDHNTDNKTGALEKNVEIYGAKQQIHSKLYFEEYLNLYNTIPWGVLKGGKFRGRKFQKSHKQLVHVKRRRGSEEVLVDKCIKWGAISKCSYILWCECKGIRSSNLFSSSPNK